MHWFWRAAIATAASVAWYGLSIRRWTILGDILWRVESAILWQGSPQAQRPWCFLISAMLYGAPPAVIALAVFGLSGHLASRRMNQKETRCRRCGYILRGITEPRCPECGEKI